MNEKRGNNLMSTCVTQLLRVPAMSYEISFEIFKCVHRFVFMRLMQCFAIP